MKVHEEEFRHWYPISFFTSNVSEIFVLFDGREVEEGHF